MKTLTLPDKAIQVCSRSSCWCSAPLLIGAAVYGDIMSKAHVYSYIIIITLLTSRGGN